MNVHKVTAIEDRQSHIERGSQFTYLQSVGIVLLLVQYCVHIIFHLEVGSSQILVLTLVCRQLRAVVGLIRVVQDAVRSI